MINVTIAKWGNSLALRIPQSFAAQLGVKENTRVSLELVGDQLIIKRGQSLDEMMALITEENKHKLIDHSTAQGKEMI
jgi:Growth regulator